MLFRNFKPLPGAESRDKNDRPPTMQEQLDRIENSLDRLTTRAARMESRLCHTMIALGVPTHIEKRDPHGRR